MTQIDMIDKSNKQVLNIYIKRNLQITKNSQSKCVKDEQFKSSFVFDTISLKQIFAPHTISGALRLADVFLSG